MAALILVPTRELAIQMHEIASNMAKFTKVRVGLLIGGNISTAENLTMLDETVHIIVGTTGRVKDIIKKRQGMLNECKYFVLDEADKLVSNDFQYQIEDIIDTFKNPPQILMYSATFPITIKSFKQKYMPKAEVLNCMDELMLLGLTHYYILVEEK